MPLVRFAGLHVLNYDTPVGRKALPKLADLAAAGVRLVPRVTGVQDGEVMLDNDQRLRPANVIWCTGFTEAYP